MTKQTELPIKSPIVDVKHNLTVVRTVRSVHFTCGCSAEYSVPNPYGVDAWNPHTCREHKSPEARQAIVQAAQEAILQDMLHLIDGGFGNDGQPGLIPSKEEFLQRIYGS